MTTKVSKEFMEELRKLHEAVVWSHNRDALTIANLIERYCCDLPHIISYIEVEREDTSNDRLHQVISHVTNRFEPMFEEEKKYYVANVGNTVYSNGIISGQLLTCPIADRGLCVNHVDEALTDEDIEFLQKRYGSENVELIEVK